ncbi:MAG: iron-sulfur cluster assembly accessory protein [Nitratireductor sp.]|nr:iron-sulfur cluster assembly accessory protein [Nitratireductor sp.]
MAFEVITVNEAAQTRIGDILSKNPGADGIRIGVKNAGCAGMEYTVALVTEPDPKDDKVATPGGNVYVDPKATLFLLGTELGFEVTKLKTGFTFNNPNQTSACGCGESVELKPAEMTPEMLREREMRTGG